MNQIISPFSLQTSTQEPMTNFFYTDANGQKHGPINDQLLRVLVTQNKIRPDTSLETDTGYKGVAGQIPGLFVATPPQPPPPIQPPISLGVPVPPQSVSMPNDKDEIIEFSARPDWLRGYIGVHLFSGFLLFCACMLFVAAVWTRMEKLRGIEEGENVFPEAMDEAVRYLIATGGGLILLVAFVCLSVWLVCISTKLTITSKKVILWRGIFSRTEFELLHSHIQSVIIHQGFLQRLVGAGSIQIASAATSGGAAVFAIAFRNPDLIKKMIQRHQQEYSDSLSVR